MKPGLSILNFGWRLASVMALFLGAIGVAGYLYFRQGEILLRQAAQDQLVAIADLKVRQINNWRHERIQDLNVILEGPSFIPQVQTWLANPGAAAAKEAILAWLSFLKQNFHYEGISLVTTQANLFLSVPHELAQPGRQHANLARQALKLNEILASDLHREAGSDTVYFDLLVPLLAPAPAGAGRRQPLGLVLVEINASESLYPLIQTWPTPSRSAETMLIRREGDNVLFLNELRHQKDTALKFRLPLAGDQQMLPLMAMHGHKGLVEGLDYRKTPCLGVIQHIPESDWTVITKMDQDEIYAALFFQTRFNLVLLLALGLLAALGIRLVWQQRELVFARQNMAADRQRLESEGKFRVLFDQAAVGVAQFAAATGRFLSVNGKLCQILEYPPEELLARHGAEITHPEDQPREQENMGRLIQGQATEFAFEKRCLKKDGSVVWVRFSVSALWRSPEPPGSCVAIVEDITRRKQAEDALVKAWVELEQKVEQRTAALRQANAQLQREVETRRHTETALAEAELRYRTVADFTYDWEYWETPDGRMRYCSPSCERIAGFSREEFMEDPKLLQQIVHPQDRELYEAHNREVVEAPGPKAVQFRIRRKDGVVRWLEHLCQPVVEQDGTFLGARGSNRDITRRIEAAMEKERLHQELSQVARVTTAGQLAASLAHELNQPLAAIYCNAKAAERFLAGATPDLGEVKEALGDIQEDSTRAGQIIHRLRAMFNKTGQERSPLQLNEVIQETIGLLRSELVLKGVALEAVLEPGLPEIDGHRVELQQVMLNLAMNAIEAMAGQPAPTRQLLIATHREEAPPAIRTAIRDTGPGIPEANLGDLFKPFYTTKTTGMGMGLVICQNIVQAHGGRLWAANNQDRGATFFLILPVTPEPAS